MECGSPPFQHLSPLSPPPSPPPITPLPLRLYHTIFCSVLINCSKYRKALCDQAPLLLPGRDSATGVQVAQFEAHLDSYNSLIHILIRFALSPRLFSKATKMISGEAVAVERCGCVIVCCSVMSRGIRQQYQESPCH
ncbi:hypothetical protein E2C01_007846 [Portunus trituberculatus]|uniref:Uncharacterized protein n=1 Tax=Portunus trituberculatus TaxID=210409 RepID=A0A5B7CZ89_PORTR|nr:hypothetical protein [Portunus trituberculatus]